MGIIDNLRNIINQKKEQQQSNISTEYKINNLIMKDGNELIICNQGVKYRITHGNGDLTNVITAEAIISKPGDTIRFGSGAPICFEIPIDMNIQQVFQMGFLQELEDRGCFRNLNHDRYNILGRVTIKDGYWEIENMSNTVLQNIEELNRKLQQEREQELQKRAYKARREYIDMQLRMEQENKKREQENKLMNEHRKNNITFTNDGVRIENGEYLDTYKTVDKYTGEEIILTKVRNIGRDEQLNYLYTANMIKLYGNVNYLGRDEFNAVTFSTAYPLNQIEGAMDQQLIETISELLSVNNLSDKEMTYLGHIDINKNITRRLEQTSQFLQSNVRYQQEQYRIQQGYLGGER